MESGQGRIAIVTESPQIAGIVGSKLDRDGFKTVWRSSGQGCLQSLRSDRPDLIVLDSVLSDLSGYDLLGRIRSSPGSEAVPVFVLLDVLQERSPEEFLRGGAREVLVKPFRPTDLSKRIRKTLKGGSGG